MLKVLDLFSGIGGFSLGLERTGGFETVAFCEIDPYCRKVLRKHWPGVPILEDVRNIDANGLGRIDVITGGYPCQPFSQAGKLLGAEDDRHLWPAMLEVIKDVRPAWVIGENVAGHISMGLDQVLSDLEGEGYAARTFVIPAVAVDAPHRRDRCWIMANSGGGRCRQPESGEGEQQGRTKAFSASEDMSDAEYDGIQIGRGVETAFESHKGPNRISGHVPAGGKQQTREILANANHPGQPSSARGGESNREAGYDARRRGEAISDANDAGRLEQRLPEPAEAEHAAPECGCRWLPEPGVGRVAHGIPNRVDRLKDLGNAVIPQIPVIIGKAIMSAEGMDI